MLRFPGTTLRLACKDPRLQDFNVQVWRGALLLADLVLAQPRLVAGHIAIELGAGCGWVRNETSVSLRSLTSGPLGTRRRFPLACGVSRHC